MARSTSVTVVSIGLLVLLQSVMAQPRATESTSDPLSARVTILELDNQTVFDGIAKLTQIVPLSVSIERELTSKQLPRLSPVLRFTDQIKSVSVRDALDWLFRLDPRYTWKAHGTSVNVFPVSIQRDIDYPLNRTVEFCALQEVTSATGAVIQVAKHASPPQQIAVLQLGNTNFARPISMIFAHVTLREALDQIAQRLGPTYGWQLSGTIEFRYLAFHERLIPEQPPEDGPAKK